MQNARESVAVNEDVPNALVRLSNIRHSICPKSNVCDEDDDGDDGNGDGGGGDNDDADASGSSGSQCRVWENG